MKMTTSSHELISVFCFLKFEVTSVWLRWGDCFWAAVVVVASACCVVVTERDVCCVVVTERDVNRKKTKIQQTIPTSTNF